MGRMRALSFGVPDVGFEALHGGEKKAVWLHAIQAKQFTTRARGERTSFLRA